MLFRRPPKFERRHDMRLVPTPSHYKLFDNFEKVTEVSTVNANSVYLQIKIEERNRENSNHNPSCLKYVHKNSFLVK